MFTLIEHTNEKKLWTCISVKDVRINWDLADENTVEQNLIFDASQDNRMLVMISALTNTQLALNPDGLSNAKIGTFSYTRQWYARAQTW